MTLELKRGKNNRILKPTHFHFPYDSVFGWMAFNLAKMEYYRLTGRK